MKSLVCVTPGQFEYFDKEIPGAEEDSSLLKITRVGVCGTDLHAFEGTQPFFSYPRVLGHELAAEYVSGNAEGFTEGDRVTFIPYFSCRTCVACRAGKENCCVDLRVCGVHIDGGMAEYISVPNYSLVHGQGLTFEELALVEPLAIGAHGIRRAQILRGESVLVVGAGPIGLAVMEFARIAGGKVIALDINAKRLLFCKKRLQVEFTIDASGDDAFKRLQEITNGDLASVVIDATGNQKAINNAFRYLAHGGRYVLVGLQKGDVSFSHPEFHKREATLMSSRNATRKDFEHVMHTIQNRNVDPTTYITHKVTFNDVRKEFGKWLNPENGVIKAMIEM